MSLADKALAELTQRDIQNLIDAGVQEGARVEYKRQSYDSSDSDKKEFLKDITSFANSIGGHLVIGVKETHGLPVAILPLTGDQDAERLRLESLARDGIEPRIGGIQFTSVPVDGGWVIVARVPHSWNAPHRVGYKGSSRFYGRNSAGTYEFSVDELRAKFNASASAMERAKGVRQQRLALIAAGEGIVPLAKADGVLILHIMPLTTMGEAVVDLRLASDLSAKFLPIGSGAGSPEFNFDGFASIRSGREVYGYTQLFRDGMIEATKVRIVASHNNVRRIPALDFGAPLLRSVVSYLEALQALAVPTPFAVMVTLTGVRGSYLGYSEQQWFDDPAIIRQDVLELPAVIMSEFGDAQTYHAALRPAFDALWNAGGLPSCTYFDEAGVWSPHH